MSRKRQKTTHDNFATSTGNGYAIPPPITLHDALLEFSEALEVAAKLGEGLMIELLMGWAEQLRLKWAYMRDSGSLENSPGYANESRNGIGAGEHHAASSDAMRNDVDTDNEEENDELFDQYLDGQNTKFLHTATFKSFNLPVSTAEGLGYLLPSTSRAFNTGLTTEQIRAQAIQLRHAPGQEELTAGAWNRNRWTALAIACNGKDYLGDEECIRCSSGGGPFERCTYWDGMKRYRCSNCTWDNERCAWPQLSKYKKPKKLKVSTCGNTTVSGRSTDATISICDDRSGAEAEDDPVEEDFAEYQLFEEETVVHEPVEHDLMEDEPLEDENMAYEAMDGEAMEQDMIGNTHLERVVLENGNAPLEQAMKIFNLSNQFNGLSSKVRAALGPLSPETLTDFTTGLTTEQITNMGISIDSQRWPKGYIWKGTTWKAVAVALKGEVMAGDDACKLCKTWNGKFTECYLWKDYCNSCANCITRKSVCMEPRSPKPVQYVPTANKQLTPEPEPMHLDEAYSSDGTISPIENAPVEVITPHFSVMNKYLDEDDFEEASPSPGPEHSQMEQDGDKGAAPFFSPAEDVSLPVNPGYKVIDQGDSNQVDPAVGLVNNSFEQDQPSEVIQPVNPVHTPFNPTFFRLGDFDEQESDYSDYSDADEYPVEDPVEDPLSNLVGDSVGDSVETPIKNPIQDPTERPFEEIGDELIRHLEASLSASASSSHVSSPERALFSPATWAPAPKDPTPTELPRREPPRRAHVVREQRPGTPPQTGPPRRNVGRPRKLKRQLPKVLPPEERLSKVRSPHGKMQPGKELPPREHPQRERRPPQREPQPEPEEEQLQPQIQLPKKIVPAITITTRIRPSLIIKFRYNPHAKLPAKTPATKQPRIPPTTGIFSRSISRHKITASAPPVKPVAPPALITKKPTKATFPIKAANPRRVSGPSTSASRPAPRPAPKSNQQRPGSSASKPIPAVLPSVHRSMPADNIIPRRPVPSTSNPNIPRRVAPLPPAPLIIPQASTSDTAILIKSSPVSSPTTPTNESPNRPSHIPISQMLTEGISLRSSAFTPADNTTWCDQKWRAYKIAKHGVTRNGAQACVRCQAGTGRFAKCYYWEGKYSACSTCSWQKASCVFAPGTAPEQ